MKKCRVLVRSLIILGIVLLGGLSAKSVYAADIFKYDKFTISQGDLLYLPYIMHNDSNVYAYEIKNGVNSGTFYYYYDDIGDMIYGRRVGNNTMYALDSNYNILDAVEIYVVSHGNVGINATTSIGFYAGQVRKRLAIQVPETGTYEFSLSGPAKSRIEIRSEYEVLYESAGSESYIGNNFITSLKIYLEAGREYFVDLCNYATDPLVDAPKSDVIYNFTCTKPVRATSVSLTFDDADVLKHVGNKYYIKYPAANWEKTISVQFYGEGGIEAVPEYFECASTNTSKVIVNKSGENQCTMYCLEPGISLVSVTTENMLTDTIEVILWKDLIKGDVNLDGYLQVDDVYELYDVINGRDEKYRVHDYADMNGDGKVDDADLNIMWSICGTSSMPYTDVDRFSDWFYDAVKYNYTEHYMTGLDFGRFGPYENLSRAQFAMIIYRMNSEPEVQGASPFCDVAGDEWYADAVIWANQAGIITGFKEDGTFRPADLITREQMITMMYRYEIYLGHSIGNKVNYDGYNDASSVSSYAMEAMAWAVGNNIITGKSVENGKILDPWGATARAEAAAIISRFSDH